MAVPVSQLDNATREYLCNASREANATQPGVVVPLGGSYFVGPRSGWLLLTLVGIGLLVLTGRLANAALELPRNQIRERAGVLAVLAALGALSLVTAFARWRRKEEGHGLGNFLYADSAQLWIVQDGTVTAVEYTDRISVDGTHYYTNGSYTHTGIDVQGLDRFRHWSIPNRWLAERFAGYLRIMGHIRQSGDPTNELLVALRSPHIGRFALLVLDKDEGGSPSNGTLVNPPRLEAVRAGAPALGWGGAVRRCAALGVIAAGLVFALPPVFEELRERRLFREVEQAQPYAVVSASDAYLKEFRDSHRSETVNELRDERLFAGIATPITGAAAELDQIDRYLADCPRGRHTAEVRDFREDHFAVLARQPGTHKETVRAIDNYLSLHPNGRYVAELRELREERFYALAKHHFTYTNEYPDGADTYLTAYPAGKYAAEVRARRDDHLFAIAQTASKKNDSPSELRKYLADKQNTRHRAEATQLIGMFYDRAIAELRTGTKGPQKVVETATAVEAGLRKLDRSFVGRAFLPFATEAVRSAKSERAKVEEKLVTITIGLLEALKTADNPVLTVAFIPELVPEPDTEDTKELETVIYSALINGTDGAELRAIERTSPKSTAVVPYASAFDAFSVLSRETMIFNRLEEALRKGVKADILTLRKAAAGEKANIVVRYRVYPTGRLATYREVDDYGNPTKVLGLVRLYNIDWTIGFQPPGSDKVTEYKARTQPGEKLLYRQEAGDPNWAIYAVTMYSAFYDLSDKMIWAFGQNPGKAPTAFTFAGTGSQREDRTFRPSPDPLPRKRPTLR